jgi:hypothetical protein
MAYIRSNYLRGFCTLPHISHAITVVKTNISSCNHPIPFLASACLFHISCSNGRLSPSCSTPQRIHRAFNVQSCRLLVQLLLHDAECLSKMSSHSNNEDETNSAGDEVTRAQGSCISEQIYIQSGNDKKVLHLLSIGLTDNNNNSKEEPLFSLDQEPWLKLPKSSIIRPRNNDYVHEIARRANLFHIIPAPRPKNWTRAQTLEWLERNAISNEADVAFLRNEVRRLRRVFERQMQEQQESLVVGSGGSGSNNGSWRGSVPYLRVIMCLTQDNVKALFLTRANSQSRQQLDARNSNNR